MEAQASARQQFLHLDSRHECISMNVCIGKSHGGGWLISRTVSVTWMKTSVQQGFLVCAFLLCKGHEALRKEGDEAMVMGEEASEQSVWDSVGLPGSQIT